MFKFLTSKPLWVNIVAGVVGLLLLLDLCFRLDPANLIHHARAIKHVEVWKSSPDFVPMGGGETVSLESYPGLGEARLLDEFGNAAI